MQGRIKGASATLAVSFSYSSRQKRFDLGGTDWEEAVYALLIEFAVESNAICVVQRRLKFA
jgi:hypothetical protein